MTPPDQPATAAAAYETFAAIKDPVECVRQITEYGRTRGNLPPDLAALRRARLWVARHRDGRRVDWLASQVKLAASGISRLTARRALATEEAAA